MLHGEDGHPLAAMDARSWAAFAEEVRIALPPIRRRATEFAESVIPQSRGVAMALMMPGLDGDAFAGFAGTVVPRAEQHTTPIEGRRG